jgi:3-hydroxybutyryl-CoA dehydrogenase
MLDPMASPENTTTNTRNSSALFVGIIGSGIMGAGITEVFAKAGHSVIVRSRSESAASDVFSKVDSSLKKQLKRSIITQGELDTTLARIRVTTSLQALGDCDVIIESVVEDLETKIALFNELDAIAKPSALLTSNTSTLPIIELARATTRPDKVCGIHFFNPATTMSLVEIVRTITTSDDTIAAATELVESCGKNVVHVRDDAGFIVNALLFPYLNNAVKMYERGTASMKDIDTAMKGGCNFPMGPFALLDLVGLDTSVSILNALNNASPDAGCAPAKTLVQLVSEGKLGRKSGSGFFTY